MNLPQLALTGCVAVAGAIGAGVRYLLGRFIAERARSSFPFGTLLINSTGAFLIGLLFACANRKLIPSSLQLVLVTGFLGGYTTFSTMSWEGVQLLRGGNTRHGLQYLGGTLVFGLCAVALGFVAGRMI